MIDFERQKRLKLLSTGAKSNSVGGSTKFGDTVNNGNKTVNIEKTVMHSSRES